MRGIFVTGTDTDAGKTTVGVAILLAAGRRGLVTAAMKPVESGCRREAGRLRPADAERLAAAASPAMTDDPELVCPYRLEAPVAPSVAARGEGVRLEPATIESAHAALAGRGPDLLLVEGAGGLLVPIDDDGTSIADLAARLSHPLLVVARDRLGVMNHVLLTLEVAAARGLTVAGVVLNVVDEREVVESNLEELRRHASAPVLGRMPRLPSTLGPAEIAERTESALDLDRLLGPRPQ